MDYNALLQQMGQKRQEIGQRYAELPNIEQKTRESLFGNDQVLKGLQGNETSKIQELYGHDKVLADRYANPESEGYLADPYAREKARAMRFQGTAGELSDVQNQIQTRRDVIGDALERAMKLINYGLEAKKLEMEGLKDEFDKKMQLDDFLFKKQQANKPKEPTEGDKASAQYDEMVKNMTQGRMTLGDALARYSKSFDPNTIFGVYTAINTRQGQGKTKTQYGAPVETPEQLSRLGILKNATYDPSGSSSGSDFDLNSISSTQSSGSSAKTNNDPLKIR